MTKNEKDFIKTRYVTRFKASTFSKALKEYQGLEDFAPNGNVFEQGGISDEAHFVMRLSTQYHLTEAFKAMKIDLTDANVSETVGSGNIGTPGRIAKVWCGFDTHDDRELGGGRWSKSPRLADFPNKNTDVRIAASTPITKRVDLISNCSHHFIPFHSKARPDSYVIISYIPNKFKLGISKLQRITNHVSQRFWLQEDLTNALYKEIADAADTEDVYVGLYNIVHGCESLRGSMSGDGAFSSEAYGGRFWEKEFRDQALGR